MRSIYLLGKDTADEWRLVTQLGGNPNAFFRATQRIAWGLTQPGMIRVDVVDTARKLVASHGKAFPAHLYAAWVWRARDPDRAARDLETARALAIDHPQIGLLPTEAEWRLEPTPQVLVEIIPGRIWRVAHQFPMAGSPLLRDSVATVIKLGSGDVAILNPVAFDERIARAIAQLGTVRWLIVQGKGHSAFVEPARRQFPEALAVATEGHLRHQSAHHLTVDGVLGALALPAELERFPIAGHLFDEEMILDRPSKTLIAQDVIAFAGDVPAVSRMSAFAFGLVDPVGFASFSLLLWRSMPALHASLAALRTADIAHVLGAHGPIAPRAGDVERMHALIDHVRGISGLGHKAMLARVFAAQPGFPRDLLRYLKDSKGKPGARLSDSAA